MFFSKTLCKKPAESPDFNQNLAMFFLDSRTVLSGYVFPWTTAACFGLFAMFRAYGAVLYAGDRMARMKGILKGNAWESPLVQWTNLGVRPLIVWYFMFIAPQFTIPGIYFSYFFKMFLRQMISLNQNQSPISDILQKCVVRTKYLVSNLNLGGIVSVPKTQKKRMFSNDFSPLVGCWWNAQHVHFTLCKLWNWNGS